ncbi:BYPASS-related protein [Tanacetum coccineum]
MMVEMADTTKRTPIGIVENILIKIDKFIFPSAFVVMDMLYNRNETMILGIPFLAIIYAEIDVFNKEMSLGIDDERVAFDMSKKTHNFTTPIGKIHMINSSSDNESTYNTSSDRPSRFENDYNFLKQERSLKKPKRLKFDIILHSKHFCKPVKQILNRELRFWPTCDPNKEECNEGVAVYGMDKGGVLNKWLEEWCSENSNPNTPESTTIQENFNLTPKDYHFKDCLLTKVGHTDVSEPVKKTLLKTWLIDCFQGDLVKDPQARSFDDYKWMFDLEIDLLAEKYDLGIGKKGHILDDIWEGCKKVWETSLYGWHDHDLEENEKQEASLKRKNYAPPQVLAA